MSYSQDSKMSWSCLNTKEDLLKMFTGHIDLDVIKLVIDIHQDNLLLAHRDLLELVKTANPELNQSLSINKEKDQTTTTNDSNNSKIIDWERLSQNETPTNRILYLVSKGFKVMVFMRGCTGSGKSYQASNILNKCYKNADVNNFIFSADNFFIDKKTGRYHFNKFKLSKAHQWMFQNVQEAVQYEVTPVIIDNTNTQIWEMENYSKLAVNNGYWIEIIEPTSEWAWDINQLFKKNKHNVSHDVIIAMMNRYEHVKCADDLLTRLKLKYNKINQPPKLSNNAKKYKFCENIIDEGKVINKPQIEINDCFINDNFKDLHVSKKKDNFNDIKCHSFNNSDEDPWGASTCISLEEEKNAVLIENDNSSHDIPVDLDEDCHSSSSTERASNYINKYVNTSENEFLFMEVLNEIPEEEYSSFVVFGTNRDINEGNSNVLNVPTGTLNKGTTTHDLIKITHQPSLNKLCNFFPENVCLLITEFFDKCEGDIDWVLSLLEEAGHFISKQQLYSLIQNEDNNYIESTILPPKTATLPENKFNEDTDGEKKTIERKQDSIKKKLQLKDKSAEDNTILKTNIENKFVFGDSLYSEQLLKIKKFKENQAIFDNKDIMTPKSGTIKKDVLLKNNDKGKFVQLVVDTSVLTQLCDYFGDFSSNLSKSTLPMSVKLPEKLAEDLYYCLIANVPSGIMDQEVIVQDEILAKKLQEECEMECASNISHPFTGEYTFAAVLSKKLLLDKFKHLDSKHVQNVLQANNCKLQENCTENHELHNYTEEALGHAQMRQQYMTKANQSLRTKIHPAVVGYYNDKAEESKQKEKHAQYKALEAMVEQNETGTSLDLHNLSVKNAAIILDLFLDNQIMNLRQLTGMFGRGRQLTIITGRGKHSPNGIARIKPVVVRKLQVRKLMYLEPEKPGFIMVIIKKNSLLNSEL